MEIIYTFQQTPESAKLFVLTMECAANLDGVRGTYIVQHQVQVFRGFKKYTYSISLTKITGQIQKDESCLQASEINFYKLRCVGHQKALGRI